MTKFFVLGMLALGAVSQARADSYRYQCVCPKPSCGVYAVKKVFLFFNDERKGEIQFRYIDGPNDNPNSQVDILGSRSAREDSDTAAIFRELALIDAGTRAKRTTPLFDANAPTGSYLKVEKTLLSGEDKGRVQWVGEKDQGAFALMYYCSALSD